MPTSPSTARGGGKQRLGAPEGETWGFIPGQPESGWHLGISRRLEQFPSSLTAGVNALNANSSLLHLSYESFFARTVHCWTPCAHGNKLFCVLLLLPKKKKKKSTYRHIQESTSLHSANLKSVFHQHFSPQLHRISKLLWKVSEKLLEACLATLKYRDGNIKSTFECTNGG